MTSKRIDILAQRVRAGDESAVDPLYEDGYRFVRWIARQRRYHLGRTGTLDDLVQEGMVGFWEAVQSWNGTGAFRPWAEFCVRREMITAVIKANRKKHQYLNEALYMDAPTRQAIRDGDHATMWDMIGYMMTTDEPADISEVLEEQERHADLHTQIDAMCATMTPVERHAFLGIMRDGFSYQALAEVFGTHAKGIDNAVQRARRKAQKWLKEVSA